MKKFISISIILGIAFQGVTASGFVESPSPSLSSPELFQSEALSNVSGASIRSYTKVGDLLRRLATHVRNRLKKTQTMVLRETHDPVQQLESILGVELSASGKSLITSYLRDHSSGNIERYVQHGIRIYEAAIMDHLFLRHVSDNMEALNKFKWMSSHYKTRRNFFAMWLGERPHSGEWHKKYGYVRFQFFLLSVLELDGSTWLIHHLVEPKFKELVGRIEKERPEIFKKPEFPDSHQREKIPFIYAFWRVMSLINPALADTLNFSRFLTTVVLGVEPLSHEVIPHKSYAFWGDTIWARVIYGRLARDKEGNWDRVRLHEAGIVLLNNWAARHLLKGILRRESFPRAGITRLGIYFEVVIVVAYAVYGGAAGSGVEMVDLLLTKLFSRKWPGIGETWPPYVREFVDRWLRVVEVRPLAHAAIAPALAELNQIRTEATRYGFDPVDVDRHTKQTENLLDALQNKVSGLPERYRLRWERLLVHTLAAIVAHSGFDTMSWTVSIVVRSSWKERYIDLLGRYSSDPRWVRTFRAA